MLLCGEAERPSGQEAAGSHGGAARGEAARQINVVTALPMGSPQQEPSENGPEEIGAA